MFLELIATIVAGIACAGVIILLGKAVGGKLPRWLTPVAAGLGMIAMTISNEYTWFGRTVDQLPEGIEIAVTVEENSWFRPWTKVWPYTKRFIAVDTGTAKANNALPDQRLADLFFFGRWSPVNQAPMLFDCATNRSALLVDGATFESDGAVSNAEWQTLSADDPLLELACET